MKIPKVIYTSLICGLLSTATSFARDNVVGRIYADDSLRNVAAGGTLANPALTQLLFPASLTQAEGGYAGSGGRAARYGFFNATTYLRYGTSTITGAASYDNGTIADQGIIETSDPELVYPYFMTDDIGGRLRGETYAFSGSYSRLGNSLGWGVRAGYRARQQYRTRDPRPKNTSGLLDLQCGIALHAGSRYLVAAGISYRNYRQTNDIMFVSELGETPVYHTLGLGTIYRRFTGAAKSAAYKGNRFGGSLDLISADRKGFFATAGFSRFSFDKILKDLNNLPLNHAAELARSIHAGWEGGCGDNICAIHAHAAMTQRKGSENIFGEPTGNIYPLLATLESYTDRRRDVGAGVFWQSSLRQSRLRISILAEGGYAHRRQAYIASDPVKVQTDQGITAKATFSLSARIGRDWLAGLMATADIDRAARENICGGSVYCFRNIDRLKAAAGLRAGYSHNDTYGLPDTNQWNISLNISF